MRAFSLILMASFLACKSSVLLSEEIVSGPSKQYTLDLNLDDCENHLSFLKGYEFLRVQTVGNNDEINLKERRFRKYKVLTSVTPDSRKLRKVNLNCIIGLSIQELNQYFGLDLCSNESIFPEWNKARIVFTGLFYNVFVDIDDGHVRQVKDGFIVDQ